MAGIIVQLILSWIIIWLFEKKHLNVLGFYPTAQRVKDGCLFFIITACICSAGFI